MISVCLCTFNGEKHLRQQMTSILGQLAPDDELLISDDHSSDRTVEVAESIGDSRVRVIENSSRERGPVGNFSNALENAVGDYYFLSDQDDIWIEGRVTALVGRMKELEATHGAGAPLLVFSDSTVMNEDCTVVEESFVNFEGLDPQLSSSYKRLAVQNVGQGCTFLLNPALVKLACPIPDAAKMHDHWILLVASVFGKIAFVPQPLVYYRQHRHNTVGAREFGMLNAMKEAFTRKAEIRASLAKDQIQSLAFAQRYKALMSEEVYRFFEAFGQIGGRCFLYRRLFCLTHRLRMSNWVRTCGLYIFI